MAMPFSFSLSLSLHDGALAVGCYLPQTSLLLTVSFQPNSITTFPSKHVFVYANFSFSNLHSTPLVYTVSPSSGFESGQVHFPHPKSRVSDESIFPRPWKCLSPQFLPLLGLGLDSLGLILSGIWPHSNPVIPSIHPLHECGGALLGATGPDFPHPRFQRKLFSDVR